MKPKNENVSSPYKLFIRPKGWKPLMSPKDVKPIKKSFKTKLKSPLLIAGNRDMTEAKAIRIIRGYYKDDPEGYKSDLAIMKKNGETLIEWAEQILDGV